MLHLSFSFTGSNFVTISNSICVRSVSLIYCFLIRDIQFSRKLRSNTLKTESDKYLVFVLCRCELWS